MGNASSLLFSTLFTYKIFDFNYSELHALSINNVLSLFVYLFVFVIYSLLLLSHANPHQISSDLYAR